MKLADSDFEAVIGHSPEAAPFDHERPWAGSPGGAWKFWNAVHRVRTATAPRHDWGV